MWISRDKWLDMRLSAEVSKETSEAWKNNYETLKRDHERECRYYNRESFQEHERAFNDKLIKADGEVTRLSRELDIYKKTIKEKDELIESILFTNSVKEILNEKE